MYTQFVLFKKYLDVTCFIFLITYACKLGLAKNNTIYTSDSISINITIHQGVHTLLLLFYDLCATAYQRDPVVILSTTIVLLSLSFTRRS